MKALSPVSILLAEDNEDHAELMIDTLEELNVKNHIVHVHNGEQVLAYLRQQPPYDDGSAVVPNIILLDIKMPRLNGKETLKALKSDPQFNYIPVIMVSTSGAEPEIRECFGLGASSYLTKPLQFEEFSRKIKDLNLYWVLTSELPKP